MVARQNEAEQRKRLAEELTVELQRQNEEIRVRREAVEVELSEAEPALAAAKQSVQNIRKTQLDEVRQLARPPNAVRLTMEVRSPPCDFILHLYRFVIHHVIILMLEMWTRW